MNPFSIVSGSASAQVLADAPAGGVLLVRLTVLLVLAWLAHWRLARCNPRWRVAAWRASLTGIVLVAALAGAPPLLEWPLAPPLVAPVATITARPAPIVRPAPATAVELLAEPRRAVARIDSPHEPAAGPSVAMAPARVTAPVLDAPPAEGTRAWEGLFGRTKGPGFWLRFAWVLGVVVLTARLALAAIQLSRIVGRSSAAPDGVVAIGRETADRLGGAPAVRVRQSAEVLTPCLVGLFRPVLLLPEPQCRPVADGDGDAERDLRAIFAHELAHARGHDLAWNLAAHLATIALWFHPLAWRLRGAHAAACDAVCDTVAADCLGDVASYTRTLARLALRAAAPAPAPGLAMARTSDVRRRIALLDRGVFNCSLPRRLVVPALLAFSMVVMLIGGLGITRAQEAPGGLALKAAAKGREGEVKIGRVELRVVASHTGEPLEGVSIFYQGHFDGTYRKGTVKTGKDGTTGVEWPAAATVNSLKLHATKPKFVGAYIDWDDEKHPVSLPASKELRLEPGVPMGGLVKDEDGKPVAGASVNINAPVTEAEKANYVFNLGTTETDAQGRWHIDEAPANLAMVTLYVKHPAFRHKPGAQVGGRESLVILTKGLMVKGRVVDGGGKPVKGAEAVLGYDVWSTNPPRGTTDERGEFVLANCESGPSLVTVQAEGFAPAFQDVQVAPTGETATPEFRLEPGSMLRVKVVDRAGKPIAGACYGADTWRAQRSIGFSGQADAEGRFTWKSAPRDAVQFDIFLDGYMRRRRLPLVASAEEQVVTLDPALVISGRVTDAATGQPIPRFRVVQGRHQFTGPQETLWRTDEAVDYTGGTYSTRFDFPMRAHFVRVEAPGYKPADSRAFQPDEGPQTQDFALERAEGISGVVLLPDGKPAEGVTVALATREVHVSLRGGILDRDTNAPKSVTGPDGRFTFSAPQDRFLLIALGDAGYADASSDELARSGTLRLIAWGTLVGQVRIGRQPGANEEVSFGPTRPDRRGGIYVFSYGYETQTDDQGRFRFDRVIPGPGSIARVVITEFGGGSSQHRPGWQEPVEIKPGGTTEVRIGGKGRPVVGRVVLDGTPEVPVDWRKNEPVTMELPRGEQGEGPRRFSRYAANLDQEGRFRVEDVPAGRYTLTVPVNTPPDPRFCGSGAAIGRATMTVDVPEGTLDEPVDVGAVKAELFATLKAGDLAPGFTVSTLDGKRLRLSDLNGKLVLLDFWATWCGPCLAEMPAMQDLQQTFGGDPRFVLVGMACDQESEVSGGYAKKNGLVWTQAFVGNLSGGVAASYHVRAIPATFLVGPDGRILAKNLRGPALKEAVQNALKDDKPFSAAGPVTRPSRFPITRYEFENSEKALAGAPAVVVLDDGDSDFQEARPHHDALHFLSESGQELRNLKEFNTCQSVGAFHGVALDATRGRVYISELVANRVTALDLSGRKLWRVDEIDAGALAVDPRTGNLWCCAGKSMNAGETVVFDGEGQEVESFPVRGVDIAYDPRTDGFWLVGYGITKLSRKGEVVFRKPHEGWTCVSVAADPRDGSAWVAERAHPEVARSANRLWHFDARGGVLRTWALGEKHPFAVACDPRSGIAWVVDLRAGLLRFQPDGEELPPLPVKAHALGISPTSGQVWVTTETEVLRIDGDGKVLTRSPFGTASRQSWLAAF